MLLRTVTAQRAMHRSPIRATAVPPGVSGSARITAASVVGSKTWLAKVVALLAHAAGRNSLVDGRNPTAVQKGEAIMLETFSDPTIAMRGNGYYSDHSLNAKIVIDATLPLVEEALRGIMSRTSDKPFAIADFGAADGGTSLDLMRHVVRTLRTACPHRSIALTYTDLPYNDFSTLFRRLHGVLDGQDDAPLAQEQELFTFASATSFHHQIFPDQTLSFGFSASAMHWLSGKPGLIADHVHAVGASETERAAYRKQALSDWTAILLARARELVPGGRLVLVNFCVDECGRYLGSTAVANLLDTLAKHWRRLVSTKIITEDEYRAGTIQQYYRTIDDFVAPFKDPDSPVSQAGLRLEQVSTMLTLCPFAARFRQHGDAAAFARAYVLHFRAWSQSTFVGALNPNRSKVERAAIIDQFYHAYEAEVAACPEAHWVDRVHCVQTIVKI
jgi:SAM dependent carboxyl methyltransferase